MEVPGFPDCGQYWVRVDGCSVPCPSGALQETEPNEGCFGQGWNDVVAQQNNCATICGRNSHAYDSDWFRATAVGGTVAATVSSERSVERPVRGSIQYHL
jgi:hypothetical protein